MHIPVLGFLSPNFKKRTDVTKCKNIGTRLGFFFKKMTTHVYNFEKDEYSNVLELVLIKKYGFL